LNNKKIISVLLLYLLCLGVSQARDNFLKQSTRIFAGLGAGIYSPNTKHASGFKSRGAFAAGFMRELKVGRGYQSFFAFGFNYSTQIITYQSYYFEPGGIQLYDKSMAYSYRLTVNELNLPLQYKILFNRADNHPFSFYASGTYYLRYFLPTGLKVTNQDVTVKNGSPDIQFNVPLGTNKLNSGAAIGIGLQQNAKKQKGSVFAEISWRYNFSAYSIRADYAATSVFLQDAQLMLLLGLRF